VGSLAKKLSLIVAGVFQNLSDFLINSSFGSYPIKFQSIRTKKFENSYFLVDQKVKDQIEIIDERCIFVTANESMKTLSTVEEVMVELSARGMSKNNDLIVIGGGYVQDIGTLVASLYMRGVKWIYIPTTLASMGDSCIGGKSSINAGDVKNLVGNFYPPKEVLVDPSFVRTLPNLEIVAGISEILKICFAKSFETFSACEQLINKWQREEKQETIEEVIRLSLISKQYFVENDEFDTGIRKLLNFGHSFGHAMESATDYKIPHGVAVLIGMIAAAQHPESKVSIATQKLVAICLAFCQSIKEEITQEIFELNFEKFSQALAKDKKNSNSDLVLILPTGLGLEIVRIPFDQGALVGATTAMKSGIGMVLDEIR
jgi:3-dehydroquinate synthase